MLGIVAGAAVAEADVEIAVGTERQVAAVVVRERLRDERVAAAPPAQIEPRAGSATSGSADRRKRATTVSPARVGEVDEEAAARRVVGRESQPEQPVLAARGDRRRADRESRAGSTRAVADDADAAALLDDELDGAIEGILDEGDRRGQPRRRAPGAQRGLREDLVAWPSRPRSGGPRPARISKHSPAWNNRSARIDPQRVSYRSGAMMATVHRLWVAITFLATAACGAGTQPRVAQLPAPAAPNPSLAASASAGIRPLRQSFPDRSLTLCHLRRRRSHRNGGRLVFSDGRAQWLLVQRQTPRHVQPARTRSSSRLSRSPEDGRPFSKARVHPR